jgi:uncharacterized protein DUF3631
MKSEAPAGTGATHNGPKEHIAGDRQFEVVTPSGERQSETAGLLDAVTVFAGSYLVFSKPQACAVALWALHTHVFDAADTTPYLSITSAEKASGKTRLLEVLELVVANPWLTGRVTPAVLARKVHAERPTLLLDETDATFAGDPEFGQVLRGLLNSGYRRGGKSSVCVGQGANIGYVDLDTFAPKALAGLGDLPDTVASRSIRIVLKRKAPNENVERFRRREAIATGEPLHQWAADWGERFVDELANASPELPEDLPDRAADSWEPLFAIADLAGGDWPGRARAAAQKLSGEAADADASIGVRLLQDCRAAFNGHDHLATKDLIASLAEDEEAPWGGWHKGSPISPRSLANLLEPFGVRPRTVRLSSDQTARGYARDVFDDPWNRYLGAHPPDLSDTTTQPASEQGLDLFPIQHSTPLVSDGKEPSNPHESGDVLAVSDKSQGDADTSEADEWAKRIEAYESGEQN